MKSRYINDSDRIRSQSEWRIEAEFSRNKRVIGRGRKETMEAKDDEEEMEEEGKRGPWQLSFLVRAACAGIVTDIGGFATFGPSLWRGSSRPLSFSPLLFQAYPYAAPLRRPPPSDATARILRAKTKRNAARASSRITTMRPRLRRAAILRTIETVAVAFRYLQLQHPCRLVSTSRHSGADARRPGQLMRTHARYPEKENCG